MEGMVFWTVAIFASLLVGMGKGGLPMVGMMGVPVMSLVIHPLLAAGLLLPVYIVSDVFGLITYRKHFDKRVLSIMVPGILAGVGLAWAFASVVSESAVTAIVGLIGLIFALNILLRPKRDQEAKRADVAPGVFWGTVMGFTSFMIHSGTPPYQVYTQPLKLPKQVFAGTTAIAFAIGNAAKLYPYYSLGQLAPTNLKVALILAIPASIAVFLGARLVKILPEALFYKLITWALLLISLKLLWDGAGALL